MNCPRCKLINPDWALRCDCGYDFELGVVGASYSDTELDVPQSKGGRAVLKLGIKRVGVFVAVFLGINLVGGLALGTIGAAGVLDWTLWGGVNKWLDGGEWNNHDYRSDSWMESCPSLGGS